MIFNHFDTQHIEPRSKDFAVANNDVEAHDVIQKKWNKFKWNGFHLLLIIYGIIVVAGIAFNMYK